MEQDFENEESILQNVEESAKKESIPLPGVVVGFLVCSPIDQVTVGRYALDKLAPIVSDSTWKSIPKMLTESQIELKSESHIESVLITKDVLSWTNICLLEESYITFANFPPFVVQVGPQIQVLKLDKFFGSVAEISFISCCLSLKSLTIIQMDVNKGPRMLLPSEFPNLSKTFGKVKVLSVDSIYFDNPKQLEFFKNFLHRFPKLEQISIPHPHGSTLSKAQWETLKSLQSKYLIKPVVDYLNERYKNMNLPINCIKRTVNAGGVFSSVFPELAAACAKNGAFLSNVRQKQIQSLFLSQDATLGKILYLNDGLNDRRILARWVNLEKVCLKTSVCDIRSEMKSGSNAPPLFPLLKSIHLIFDSDSKIDPEFRALKRLLHLMIGQSRSSVRELTIQWAQFGHDTPSNIINPLEVIKHLANLVKFHANNWKAWDDDLLVILRGLEKLQHLALEDCSLFTEFGFLGSDNENPVILQLQELKHLEIVNRNGSSSITDTLFVRAFSKMPLKTFVLDVSPNLVTANGYKSLTDGIFSDFIEIFPIPKNLPVDLTREEFDILRKKFLSFPSEDIEEENVEEEIIECEIIEDEIIEDEIDECEFVENEDKDLQLETEVESHLQL